TTTIPVIFPTGADPVDLGLVPSLSRPSGNVTGVTFVVNTLGAKRSGVMANWSRAPMLSASSPIPGIPLLNPRLEMWRPQRARPGSNPLSCLPTANAISTRLSQASSSRVLRNRQFPNTYQGRFFKEQGISTYGSLVSNCHFGG